MNPAERPIYFAVRRDWLADPSAMRRAELTALALDAYAHGEVAVAARYVRERDRLARELLERELGIPVAAWAEAPVSSPQPSAVGAQKQCQGSGSCGTPARSPAKKRDQQTVDTIP